MFDHITLRVANLPVSRSFYIAALAPLGIEAIVDTTDFAAFGKSGRAHFWLGAGGPPTGGVHLAFAAANRAEVRAFHVAALGAGCDDNGAPGLRPQYNRDYYGAFVFDPDGNNVEAVCRNPED